VAVAAGEVVTVVVLLVNVLVVDVHVVLVIVATAAAIAAERLDRATHHCAAVAVRAKSVMASNSAVCSNAWL
jgi:hypothetical protein